MTGPIKRHSSLIKLSREHNSGLFLALILKRDAPQYKNMPSSLQEKAEFVQLQYLNELQGHFKAEEDTLFPYVKGKSVEIDSLLEELITEHRQLESKITSIKNSPDLVVSLDEIGCLLESHIRKEERRLFQLIQESFSEDELKVLEGMLNI